jgi:restriction system protein
MARLTFEQTVTHEGLGEVKIIRGTDRYVVAQRALRQQKIWDDKWRRQQDRELKQAKQDLAIVRTNEAQALLDSVEETLLQTLKVDDSIDWESLKDYSKFPPLTKAKPKQTDPKYQPKTGCLAPIFPSMKQTAIDEAKALYKRDYLAWKKEYQKWKTGKEVFFEQQKKQNDDVEQLKQQYLQKEPSAIVTYCEMVLGNSNYPDSFPQAFEIDYNPENRILIVEYQLPSLEDIPTLKDVKYIKSSDKFKEVHISDTAKRKLYDDLVYQIALRTIHELYEADKIEVIASIVFNGWVNSVDISTGQEITPCIVSVQVNREEFLMINLERVDPKACFKSLKGIGSTKLYSLTPIAPVLTIDREDKRFVTSYGVADSLDESENLAAMDWEDFENLVRELFEKEFSQSGGEVKVTQASRDGGVDAVAFDPDPIRGGKIVIQAKRYTNVVGVSAVRDLYGTVMNEGATKGILISTSDYGSDAYEFAKGKPLTLLNGNNLLHLLGKHGYKAKIDLREAKRILAERG